MTDKSESHHITLRVSSKLYDEIMALKEHPLIPNSTHIRMLLESAVKCSGVNGVNGVKSADVSHVDNVTDTSINKSVRRVPNVADIQRAEELIVDLYSQQGLSTRRIASELNQLGLRNRKGLEWSFNMVNTVLKKNTL